MDRIDLTPTEGKGAIDFDYFAIFAVSVFFIFHFWTLFGSPLNSEDDFTSAVEFFLNRGNQSLEQYFFHQANPLAYPWLAAQLSSLVHIEPLVSLRLISLFGCILFVVSSYRIFVSYGLERKVGYISCTLILINPIVWTFSGRASNDLLPAGLGILGYYFAKYAFKQKSKFVPLAISYILFIGGFTLKYHCMLLLIPLTIDSISKLDRSELKVYARFLLLTLVGMCAYLYCYKYSTGIFIAPSVFLTKHGANIVSFPGNCVAYFSYLLAATLPMSLIGKVGVSKLRQKNILVLILCASGLISFAVSQYINIDGELNLGPLDVYLDYRIRLQLSVLLAIYVTYTLLIDSTNRLLVFDIRHSKPSHFYLTTIIGILAVVCALSLSRPSNRYLIILLPFIFLFLKRDIYTSFFKRYACMTILLICGMYLSIMSMLNGWTYEKLINYVNLNGLIQYTDPGVLVAHASRRFPCYKFSEHSQKACDIRYTISSEYTEKTIYVASSNILFISKRYYLDLI